MKKLFLEAIDLLLHIYCCFLQKEQIFKSSKRECSLDVYGTQLWDVQETNSWDVLRTFVESCSKMFFLNLAHKHIKLTLTGCSTF